MRSPKTTKKEMVTEFRTREILGAAREVIEQRGLPAMTMEEIAAAAGVAKGTLYLYFHSKDDLIQALIAQVQENILSDLEVILQAPGSPLEKLKDVVSLLLDYLGRERALFPIYARELVQSRRASGSEFWRHFHEGEQRFVTLVTGLFAEGISAGEFIATNPRLLVFLLRGMVRAVGYYQMAEGHGEAVREALPVLLTLLTSGLTQRGPSAAKEGAP